MENHFRKIINGSRVYIPLSKVVALVVVLFGAYAWLDARLEVLSKQLTVLQYRASDRWTGSDMRYWAKQLEASNSGKVKVPEPVHRPGGIGVVGTE